MLLVLAVVMMARPAAAQWTAVEVGVGVSRACIGSEGGLCGEQRGTMWATHASAWIDDRVEIGMRLALLPLEDWSYSVERDSRFDLVTDPTVRALAQIDVVTRDRSRRILDGEAIYHFARGRPLRGFLGGGFRTAQQSWCADMRPSWLRTPDADPLVARRPLRQGAVQCDDHCRIVGPNQQKTVPVRGGVRLHNLAGEGLSTSETFIATSYWFGRR